MTAAAAAAVAVCREEDDEEQEAIAVGRQLKAARVILCVCACVCLCSDDGHNGTQTAGMLLTEGRLKNSILFAAFLSLSLSPSVVCQLLDSSLLLLL